MLEIRELRHIVFIDEFRHFGRAGEAVGLSQSAMTKSLQRIERTLGAKLFERSRAGVTPTAIGVETLVRARRLIKDAADLKKNVHSMIESHDGCVTIGIGPAMSESYVSDAIANIVKQRPLCQIRIRVDHWHQLTKWLLSGELDFYIADVSNADDDPRFRFLKLPPQTLHWFCRAGHPLTKRRKNKTISGSDLVRYPIATPKMPPWAIDWFADVFQGNGKRGLPALFPTVECESYAILKRVVLTSDCVSAALLLTLSEELRNKTLVTLAVRTPQIETHAGIVRLAEGTLSSLAAELIAIIQSQAKS